MSKDNLETITETELITSDFLKPKELIDCPAGLYTEILLKEVDSGEILDMGSGDKEDGIDDRGIWEMTLVDDTGAEVKGKVRLKARDKNSDIVVKSIAPRTSKLKNGFRLGLDEAGIGATRERFLALEFLPDVDCKVSWATGKSSVVLPITQRTHPSYR